MIRGGQNPSRRAAIESQPGNHGMEELPKMAGAPFEVQPNAGYFELFLHDLKPLLNHGVKLPFKNVSHALCICGGRRKANDPCNFGYRHRNPAFVSSIPPRKLQKLFDRSQLE
jgi:hypothetical protein